VFLLCTDEWCETKRKQLARNAKIVLGPLLTVKTLCLILVIPPVASVIAFDLFAHESPYFLLMVAKEQQARIALKEIRKHFVEKEFEEMKKSTDHGSALTSLFALFVFLLCTDEWCETKRKQLARNAKIVLGPLLTVKTLCLILVIPPVASVIAFDLFAHESPYFLLMVAKEQQARIALKEIRKHFVEKEFEEMKKIHRSRISSNLTFCFVCVFTLH
jgi:1,4-dihydroxy-2-naphthoate octaprenyltransferase